MKVFISSVIANLILCVLPFTSWAQTTAFNYQGRLTDGGNPANGAFQMQFKLFDSLAAGGQVGSTINDVPVTVAQGTFAVKLDFGSNALSGANRWLEIAVRHNSGESYVTLSPREQIASSPYAVQTLNAQMLGGVPASEYVTNASVGSAFIRNGTTLQTGNFNISGNGFFGGRVGIGTTAPLHSLAVGGGPAWTTHAWGGSLDLENASAIGWRANAGGTRFGMGHTTDGFLIFRTASELGNTANQPIYDFKIDNTGNIGIGSLALNTDVSQARLNIFNLSLGYGVVNTLGAVSVGSYVDGAGGGYGTKSNHPLNFFTNGSLPQMTLATTGNLGIGTTSPNTKLQVAGHISQSRESGGVVKAMAYVTEAGSIARCYNGMTGASTPTCGFSATRLSLGVFDVNFGFQVNDRFLTLTSVKVFGCSSGSTVLEELSGNIARVNTFCGSAVDDKPFMIFVY